MTTDGHLKANRGWTDKFIFPPYDFKITDRLITNFHMPESTLLMLVSRVRRAGPAHEGLQEGDQGRVPLLQLRRRDADHLSGPALPDVPMKLALLLVLNRRRVAGLFLWLFRRKNLLSYFSGGKWWLTWLSIAVITLMDELTSIFYAPSEAFRFIGTNAIAFIAITSLLMRFLSTRMVEIAEILEHHGIRGGGVYSFSYLVLGPTLSFIAVASILVDYVLTACISTVSAVENGLTFIVLSPQVRRWSSSSPSSGGSRD